MKARVALLLLLALVALPLGAAEEGEHAQGGSAELIFKWLNFFLVFGGLGFFFRKPIQRFFAGQRAAIRSAIDAARHTRQQSEERLAEIERRLAGLEQEIEAMRKEAVANAAAERERIRQAARREAERLQATARAEIESHTRAARGELRAYTARLAVELAEKRIERQLSAQAHAALFEASLAHLTPGAGGGAGRR